MTKHGWNSRLARRTQDFDIARAVTDVLALTQQPEVISFAGGLPDPATFQLDWVAESTQRVWAEVGPQALNYGPSEGIPALRDWIAGRMRGREGLEVDRDDILVTSGGLEAINLVATALLEPGSVVLAGAPAYLAALHLFRSHECRIVSVEVDEQGLNPDALETALAQLGARTPPQLLYLNPTFQNPSGTTLTLARRQQIVDLCSYYGLPILEDHAYAELRFEGEPLPSLKSLWPEGVIFVSTFSKIFGPGLRLGWVAADPELIDTLTLCKIGSDQCSNTLGQYIILDYSTRGGIDEQLKRAIPIYRRKRDRLMEELSRNLSEVTWNRPEGGFYLWLTLPPGSDSDRLLLRAVREHRVAFVAGRPFFADGRGAEFLRLSFSFIPENQIREGVSRLAAAVHHQLSAP